MKHIPQGTLVGVAAFAFIALVATLASVNAQTNIEVPDYGSVLLKATPTLDALITMDIVLEDLSNGRARLHLAFDHAYRAQYTEANLFVTNGMALIEAIPTKYAVELARLELYMRSHGRDAIGWRVMAFVDNLYKEIAALRVQGERLRTVIEGLTGDFPADRAALDALLLEE